MRDNRLCSTNKPSRLDWIKWTQLGILCSIYSRLLMNWVTIFLPIVCIDTVMIQHWFRNFCYTFGWWLLLRRYIALLITSPLGNRPTGRCQLISFVQFVVSFVCCCIIVLLSTVRKGVQSQRVLFDFGWKWWIVSRIVVLWKRLACRCIGCRIGCFVRFQIPPQVLRICLWNIGLINFIINWEREREAK